jgi:hypothetical protein
MDGSATHRALVIGGRGVLGALTREALAAAGWTVRSGVRRVGGGGPDDVEVDLDRAELVDAALRAGEYDLVVNAVPHPGLLAERHVLEHGGRLINISALPAAAARSLRAVAAGARGTVLMNAGLAPGVTSLVAADLLRRHPGTQDLEIVLTLSTDIARGPAGAAFVHRGLTALGHHRTVSVPLPEPFGERVCLGFGEGDAGWLGGLAEGRLIRLYVCVADPAVHERLLAKNAAGSMRAVPRSLFRSRNHGAADEPVAHWIAAVREGRRLDVRTVQCRGDFASAARSTLVFADALARWGRAGCFYPEEIGRLEDLDPGLRRAGIAISPPPAPR